MYQLRPYQQRIVDSAKSALRKKDRSLLIEAATGAGKSIVISEIAKYVNEQSGGKKVLVLAPSKELVEQNHAKYLGYGLNASIYSASLSSKCTRHPVVFGTPQTIVNNLHRFGVSYACVIIDEAHGVTPTIKKIIGHMQKENPNLRVLGLTATPYRMNTGYIYAFDENNTLMNEDLAIEPFFGKLISRITAPELVDKGFLTRPTLNIKRGYDTSQLVVKSNGHFDEKSVEQAFVGHGRKTSQIVRQVVEASRDRKGVMFFAASIRHAREIMASLPPNDSSMVTGDTDKKERERIINDFKDIKYKYLVNVSVLTTGFDAPHVDVVAILRATESASLLQQIIGRGLRLGDGKKDCLVLDYAENIERHGLEDDMFKPVITTRRSKKGEPMEVTCPLCKKKNEFTARMNQECMDIDKDGYFIDLFGKHIMIDDKPMPAHHGRRCNTHEVVGGGELVRCGYRWSVKECQECGYENDIAARVCGSKDCKAELVNPNDKLAGDFQVVKTKPIEKNIYNVKSFWAREHVSKRGSKSVRMSYKTDMRNFDVWYTPTTNHPLAEKAWEGLTDALFGCTIETVEQFMEMLRGDYNKISTVTAKKEGDFYIIFAHNEEKSDDR